MVFHDTVIDIGYKGFHLMYDASGALDKACCGCLIEKLNLQSVKAFMLTINRAVFYVDECRLVILPVDKRGR